jgi:replicative DNA helicase
VTQSNFIPVDVDAEAHVLATLLTSPEMFPDIVEDLLIDDFGTPQLRLIYEAVMTLDGNSQPFTQITVAAELRRMKMLKAAGGEEFLTRLVARAGEAGYVKAHVDIVREKALLRRVMEAGTAIKSAALDPASRGPDVLQQAEEAVFALGQRQKSDGLVPMARAVAEMHAELARVAGGQMLGVSTGLPELDRLTSGFQSGQLILIGGRPGSGKSALSLQMARHIAESTGDMVAFLSYEMSRSELSFRMLAAGAKHPLQSLREGRVLGGFDKQLAQEATRMAQLPLLIDDSPPQSITGIRSAMRRLARRGDVAAIFVDYLQLLRGEGRGGSDNRVQELSEISRGLKMLASELSVPVIAGSQLSRGAVNGIGGVGAKPALHHLRDSGSLEQDASLVIFTHRPYAAGDGSASPRDATLIIAKQRNGPAGIDVQVEFEPDYVHFTSGAYRGNQQPAPPPPGDARPRSAMY